MSSWRFRGSVCPVHFVIMGCGRVGASLADQLDRAGHSVAIIDRTSDSFRRLSADFSGRKVTGMGFDRDALEQAGIDDAYAFAAVSNGDNSNIIAARVARETFGVEQVVARIYDSNRADVYERLGIATVATVRQTASQMMHRMMPSSLEQVAEDPTGAIRLIQPSFSEGWVGLSVPQVEERLDARIAWISRGASAFLPVADSVVQENDHLFVAVAAERSGAVQRILSHAPVEED